MDESRIFSLGLRLFNERDFFEAHETWEDLWHMASGQRKLFYQVLIQTAVTLVHVQRGNPRGVCSVWKRAREKMQGLPAVYMGVDLADLSVRMTAYLQPILDLPGDAFAPGQGRGQQLPVNLLETPRLTLLGDPFA